MRDCVLTGQIWKRRAEPLNVGAEIALLPARRLGRNPEIDVKLNIPTTPTIENRVAVREWHARTGILIFQILRELSPQPESIHELGAELVPLPPDV